MEATPRINAPLLSNFVNQTVRIVGKVTGLQGDTATIEAQGSINLQLNRVRLSSQIFAPILLTIFLG